MTRETRGKSWKFVGGRLCLDFVNTVGGRVLGPPNAVRPRGFADQILRDKLSGYPDLVAWSQAAGTLGAREAGRLLHLSKTRPREAVAVYVRSLALREGTYRVAKAVIEGWEAPRRDVLALNREALAARARERIVAAPGGYAWGAAGPASDLDCMLACIASSAAELLTSGELARVHQCGGVECGWLFLDESRNRSRQWCDMSDCGNRAKVRRFRERHRADC